MLYIAPMYASVTLLPNKMFFLHIFLRGSFLGTCTLSPTPTKKMLPSGK